MLGLTWVVRADGEPLAADDVAELRWFAPDELPAEMAFASQERVLAAWAARLTRAARPAATRAVTLIRRIRADWRVRADGRERTRST